MSDIWFGWLGSHASRARRKLRQADAARDGRDWARAAEHYSAYVALEPYDWGIRVQLGHALKEGGRLAEAEAAYRAAAAAAMPDDADVRLHLGHVLKALGRTGEAAASFAECVSALERNPSVPEGGAIRAAVEDATRRLGRDFGDQARDARDWLQAAQHYRRYLEVESSDSAIWVQLGNVSKEAQQFGSAEAAYRRAIDIAPSQAEAVLQLGHLMKLLDRRAEAQELYRRAVELGGEPEAQHAFNALAAWGPGGRGATAVSDGGASAYAPEPVHKIEKPANLTGDVLRLLLNAQAARDQRSWDMASSFYGSYLERAPSDAGVWLEYAIALRESGRYQQAYEATRRAGPQIPDLPALQREQVRSLRHLGHQSQAEALLRALMLQNVPTAGDMEIIK